MSTARVLGELMSYWMSVQLGAWHVAGSQHVMHRAVGFFPPGSSSARASQVAKW